MAKKKLFTTRHQELARFYKALSHPARVAILDYLAETGVCITGDISHIIPLSRSTINQHLNELKEADLVLGSTHGKNVKYCLNPEMLKKYRNLVMENLNKYITVDPINC